MQDLSTDFAPHFRKSPVTDAWEPLYSRRRSDAVDLRFEVARAHCNARGFLHGGVLAALCDNAMGLSLGSQLQEGGVNIVTLGLTLDYLGSAQIGDCVTIEPRVLRAGGKVGFCDALVKVGDRPIARANATFSVRINATAPSS